MILLMMKIFRFKIEQKIENMKNYTDYMEIIKIYKDNKLYKIF